MRSLDDIREMIDEEDVEFIRLQFTDMFGNLKNIAITPGQLERAVNGEFFFEGSALFDELYPYEEDLFLKPVLKTFTILPWRPQQGKVAKMLCDVCRADGTLFELSSRTILEKASTKWKEVGYKAVVDAECEFFLFHTDDNGMPTTVSHEKAGYMDVGPMDLGENARREIVLNLEDMGYVVESSHHEKAPAQHEIDFREGESVKTADGLVTFKFAVRSIAKRFGLYATFMPKPKADVAGSGMHLSISLNKDGNKIFNEVGGKYSDETMYFVGGILKYAEEICAITNPLVNSYKRIMTGFEAPRLLNYSSKGENSLIKLHKNFGETRIELRFPDPSANPYIAVAICIAAGLKGIEDKINPDELMEVYSKENKHLPENLKDAIDKMRDSEFVKEILGEEFVEIYCNVKEAEWKDYMIQVSDWEVNRYLIKM